MRVCVDPGGNGVTMNERGEGGLGPPGREKISSQFPTVETGRRAQDARRQGGRAWCDIKTSSCTEYVSMYMFIYCNLDNCNHEWRLICLTVSGEKIIW
jgi:hypothetical protein